MIDLADEKLLQQFLERTARIPASEWGKLREIIRYRHLERGDYFVVASDVAKDIGFVLSGLLRKFYQTEEGREYIKDFSPELRLVTAYSSLLQNKPSRLNIQAIESTKLLVIPYIQFIKLYEEHSCWQELGRKIAETLFIEREEREWELLLFTAQKRYELFLKKFPGLLKRVPQYDIASYLGISPVSLSRLVGKKKRPPNKLKR